MMVASCVHRLGFTIGNSRFREDDAVIVRHEEGKGRRSVSARWVHDADQGAAVLPSLQVIEKGIDDFIGDVVAGVMWRDRDIRHGPKWVIGRKWFALEHIEDGGAKLLGLECMKQSHFIDDGASSDVDEYGGWRQ